MTSVSLIKLSDEHLEKIMKWRMLPEVTKYMYTDPNITIKQQKSWFEQISNDASVIYWVICVDANPVGLLNLYDIDLANSRCAWAYYIGQPETRGKGIGTILECNIYDYVFIKLGLNKLWCEVLSTNTKVINIHKKFGSKVEGILKDHIIKNEEKLEIVRMAILKNEWAEIRSSFEYSPILIE